MIRFSFLAVVFSFLTSFAVAATAPTITTQPAAKTVTAGQSASFTVAASGTAPLSYQWKKSGTNISGATSATYTISSTTTASAGSYTVTVTNSAGSKTSNAATLTVNVAPTISTQPASQTVTAGQSASFTVVATGTPTPTYQWKKGASSVSGATSATYTIAPTTTASAGTYTVVVTNTAGTVTSSNAILTVNAAVAPTITTQPSSQTVTAGQSVSFTVVATGTPAPTYQWQKGGVSISGATSATYTIASTTTANAGTYTVVVTNSAGSKTSNSATLTVNAVTVPTITTQPVSKTVTTGQSVSFTVVATGTPTPTYQWKKNGSSISGATSATYTITSTTTASAGTYTVVVTNTAGSVTSSNAVLTVNPAANQPPVVTLTAPTANATFTLPATVTLTATASDPDGTVAKVEFFNNGVSLGSKTAKPYTLAWTPTIPGFASLTAIATDNASATTTSVAVSIALLPSLPYTADFETTEGYTTGTLNNQRGWSVTAGTAQITTSGAAHGTQTVVLNSGTTAAQVDQEFGSTGTNPPVVLIDFYAKPVAGADTTTGTLFDVDAARVAFVLNGASGQLVALDGDGLGAGGWMPLTPVLALSTGNVTTGWQRLTVRLNYTAKTYDVYLNGVMIAADLKFRLSGAAYVSWFSVKGASAASASLDDLYAGPTNPLFADVNKDGIDDAWETAHGLSLSTDNRQLSPSGNGVTVVQAYIAGTDPQDFYNGAQPTLSIVSGNNQVAGAGSYNAQPIVVVVKNAAGTPLANAPVTFTVASGGGLLAANTTGAPAPTATLSLRTAADGTARAYYQQPASAQVTTQIQVTADAAQVAFATQSIDPKADADGNGLADAWEYKYFGHTGIDPNAASADGLTNLLDYQLGLNPLVASATATYTYDSSGRLITAAIGTLSTQRFTLDGDANLTSVTAP